jgi:hypothetical protein
MTDDQSLSSQTCVSSTNYSDGKSNLPEGKMMIDVDSRNRDREDSIPQEGKRERFITLGLRSVVIW